MYSLNCCNSGVNEKLDDSTPVNCVVLLLHLQCVSHPALTATNSNLWFLLQARGLSAQPGAQGMVEDAGNILHAGFTP